MMMPREVRTPRLLFRKMERKAVRVKVLIPVIFGILVVYLAIDHSNDAVGAAG